MTPAYDALGPEIKLQGVKMMPIQELTKGYSSEFEKRATDLTEMLRAEVAAELRARLQAELEEEIAATTANLQEKEAEIAGAVGSEAFNLGVVLKLKTERLELASYLKGLQFCASRAGNGSRLAPRTSND